MLPLLEFALDQLWERRQGGWLTHDAYRAIGGLTGGLARWAEQAFNALEEALRPVARRIFTSLVHLGNESQGLPDSRRRRPLITLLQETQEPKAVQQVVQRLASARLLVTTGDNHGEDATVEIIHDALIQNWRRLQQWLHEDRRFLLWHQALDRQVQAWLQTSPHDLSQRDEDRLLRGRDLQDAEYWLQERRRDLSQSEQIYIEASLNIQKRHQVARKRWWRLIVSRLIVGLIIVAGLAAYGDQQRRIAFVHHLASKAELVRKQEDDLVHSGALAVGVMGKLLPDTQRASSACSRLGLSCVIYWPCFRMPARACRMSKHLARPSSRRSTLCVISWPCSRWQVRAWVQTRKSWRQ